MKRQLDDVNTSRLELEDLISSLTENMRTMFAETFDKINRNFKEIFSELFGGGSGELSVGSEGSKIPLLYKYCIKRWFY